MTYVLGFVFIATILIGAIFVILAPVEEAQAVHTTIAGTQINQVPATAATQCSTDLNINTLVATSNRDFQVYYLIDASQAASDTARLGDGTNTVDIELLSNTAISGVLYYPADTVVTIDDTVGTRTSGCATVIAESDATTLSVT